MQNSSQPVRLELFEKNDRKHWYKENYFSNKVQAKNRYHFKYPEQIKDSEQKLKYLVDIKDEYLRSIQIPEAIPMKDGSSINRYDVVHLLIALAMELKPLGRRYYQGIDLNECIPPFKRFDSIFGNENRAYVSVFQKADLMEKISSFFGWDTKKSEFLISFLTTDLVDVKCTNLDVLTNPFIKIGENYFWLSTFNTDRDWGVLFHKRLWRDKSLKIHQIISPNMEKCLADMFLKAGFQTVHSFNPQGLEGEIDVLAYKDGVLFVMELKLSVPDSSVQKIALYETEKLEIEASLQLNRAKDWLERQTEIKDEHKGILKEIRLDRSMKDVRIVRLVVTNQFESEKTAQIDFPKISFFELNLILTNNLYEFLHAEISSGETTISAKAGIDHVFGKRDDFSNSHDTREKCNLWEKSDGCSPNDILNAINKDRLWSFIKLTLPPNFRLESYNPNQHYLSVLK